MGFFSIFTKEKRATPTTEVNESSVVDIPNLFASNSGALFKVPAAQACIKLISDSVSTMPLRVYKMKEGKKVLDTISPYAKLLKSPNRVQKTLSGILKICMKQYLKGRGEFFIEIKRDGSGYPVGLRYYPNTSVFVQMDDVISPTEVEYHVSTSNGSKIISSDDMIHVVYEPKDNGVEAVSIEELYKQMESIATEAEKVAGNDLKSGGALTTILGVSGRANEKRMQRIETGISRIGRNGGGLLAIESEGITVNSVNSNPKDRQMVENRQYNAVDIARFYLVPASLIDAVNLNSVDVEQQRNQLLSQCIEPILRKIESAFNSIFRPSHNGKYVLAFDEGNFSLPDSKSKAESLQKMVLSGMISPNRAGELLGVDPINEDFANERLIVGGAASLKQVVEQGMQGVKNIN